MGGKKGKNPLPSIQTQISGKRTSKILSSLMSPTARLRCTMVETAHRSGREHDSFSLTTRPTMQRTNLKSHRYYLPSNSFSSCFHAMF